MARPISPAMLRALDKIRAGVPPYRAAIEEGLDKSGVYKMRRKHLRDRRD